MPLTYIVEYNGNVVEKDTISDSTDPAIAVRDLTEDLIKTASVEYSVPVLEWWFTNRQEPLTIPNGPNHIDTWIWDGN